jgi:hypothetical protein
MQPHFGSHQSPRGNSRDQRKRGCNLELPSREGHRSHRGKHEKGRAEQVRRGSARNRYDDQQHPNQQKGPQRQNGEFGQRPSANQREVFQTRVPTVGKEVYGQRPKCS